jgi:hypothetical protein
MPNVASVSGLSNLDNPFGFLKDLLISPIRTIVYFMCCDLEQLKA